MKKKFQKAKMIVTFFIPNEYSDKKGIVENIIEHECPNEITKFMVEEFGDIAIEKVQFIWDKTIELEHSPQTGEGFEE